jgi:hypothetical protein
LVHSDEIWIRHGVRVNAKKKHRKYGGWIYRKCLPLCVVSPSSILLDRRILDLRGDFDESLPVCEDYDLWLRISAHHPFLFLEERLTIKRGGHDDQLSRSDWGFDRYRLRALIKSYESGNLTPQLLQWTAAEITRKASILMKGCMKRGKIREAECYSNILQKYPPEIRRASRTSNL